MKTQIKFKRKSGFELMTFDLVSAPLSTIKQLISKQLTNRPRRYVLRFDSETDLCNHIVRSETNMTLKNDNSLFSFKPIHKIEWKDMIFTYEDNIPQSEIDKLLNHIGQNNTFRFELSQINPVGDTVDSWNLNGRITHIEFNEHQKFKPKITIEILYEKTN